jgi:surface antigen
MMFKGAESVVKNLTALGKSLILASVISTSALANEVWNPKFFDYSSNGIISRIVEFSFGWNKKLNEEQKLAYYQSIIHALEYAENGQKVSWYKDNASGYSTPVMTWPVSDGYCRRLHLSAIAYSKHRSMAVSACYNKLNTNWTWYHDK